MTFTSLGLSETTLQSVVMMGYKNPTPIQGEAIPLILQGHDVFGCAQTGTGKTASFVLPLIDLLMQSRARARLPRVLVLVPTRELAYQVSDSFERLSQGHKLKWVVLIGGESMIDQEKKISQGADIVIATPGRLLDIIERGKLLMTGIQHVVIDEADHMLDLGFIPDVNKILRHIPPKHQTLFFSATLSPDIQKLSQEYLKSPKEIRISPASSTSHTIEQFCIQAKIKDKRHILRTLIQEKDIQTAIIFCNRKADVSLLTASLKRHGFKAGMMHGDLLQTERIKTLEHFKAKDISFLVASDVAARGIDVDDLPFVINFDVPKNPEEYVHRIGRTGRAGKTGIAFTLVSDTEKKKLKAIENLIQKPLATYEVTLKNTPSSSDVKKKSEKEKAPSKATPTSQLKPRGKKVIHEPVYGFGTEVPDFFSLTWADK